MLTSFLYSPDFAWCHDGITATNYSLAVKFPPHFTSSADLRFHSTLSDFRLYRPSKIMWMCEILREEKRRISDDFMCWRVAQSWWILRLFKSGLRCKILVANSRKVQVLNTKSQEFSVGSGKCQIFRINFNVTRLQLLVSDSAAWNSGEKIIKFSSDAGRFFFSFQKHITHMWLFNKLHIFSKSLGPSQALLIALLFVCYHVISGREYFFTTRPFLCFSQRKISQKDFRGTLKFPYKARLVDPFFTFHSALAPNNSNPFSVLSPEPEGGKDDYVFIFLEVNSRRDLLLMCAFQIDFNSINLPATATERPKFINFQRYTRNN